VDGESEGALETTQHSSLQSRKLSQKQRLRLRHRQKQKQRLHRESHDQLQMVHWEI